MNKRTKLALVPIIAAMPTDSLPTLNPADGVALLLTDVVDSTDITERLGEAGAARLWAIHDRVARDLLPLWRGREIDKSDGFLMLFASVMDALGYAGAYHRALAQLETPLAARAGIHFGPVSLRETPPSDVARGAKPLEVDGLAKPTAARIMGAARGRQTLLSATARAELTGSPGPHQGSLVSHGHWRFKGVDGAIELFEAVPSGSAAEPPAGGPKAWRVVRQGDLWLPMQAVPHSLPAERDKFIGRAAELSGLRRRFQSGARLVSLVGPGGTGKTRMAMRFGWDSLGDNLDGVWFCDLSTARSADGVVHAMAQGLRISIQGSDPVQQIGAAIAGRPNGLVIVDNFEQVAEHAVSTLGAWLDRAPLSRFCVTTREVLGLVGEHVVPVHPLPSDDAVALLRERGSAAGARSFEAADEAAIPELVRLLDGLPLAIELAAARLPVLPPARLLPRMGERFRMLASPRGRTDRHATLRATLEWSWDLLGTSERSALAQLSVFEGGFDLAAVESVLDLSDVSSESFALDTLDALVRKSLVRAIGQDRFDLLRAVRAFAAERLSPSSQPTALGLDAASVELRHARYYGGFDERTACANRCADTDNLVSATRHMVRARHVDVAGAALLAAWSPLRLTGPFSIAVELATDVLKMSDLPDDVCAMAHWVAGSARGLLGEVDAARRDLERALELSATGSLASCRAACALGELESDVGEALRAEELLHTALDDALLLGDAALQCRAMNAIGGFALDRGDLVDAADWYERALRAARDAGDRRWEGGVLGNLGVISCSQGDLAAGCRQFEQALECARDAGDLRFEGNTRCNLGLALVELGSLYEGQKHLQASLASARLMGHARLETTAQSNLGLLAERQGRHAAAVEHHQAAVDAAIRQKDRRSEGRFRAYLARSLARVHRGAQAQGCLQRGLKLLADAADDTTRALLLCASAEVEWLSGRAADAREHLDAARLVAQLPGVVDSGELASEIDRLEALLPGRISPC